MKKIFLMLPILLLITASSCEEEVINQLTAEYSAKEKIGEVRTKARNDFAPDAELTAIYGREVGEDGKVELLNTTSVSAFVYVMQSDAQQANEFYVPLVTGPVQSPVNFTTALSFVKDSTAKDILGRAFNLLSTIHIDPAATYDDSPQILTQIFAVPQVNVFRNENVNEKIDMLLLPSKSLDSLNVSNSADWIVNFYTDSRSLVLWKNTGSGEIKIISQ